MTSKCILLALLLTALAVPAQAQLQSSKDPEADSFLRQGIQAQALTVLESARPLPTIQPKLPNLRRSYKPSVDKLIEQFLGSRDTLIGAGEAIVSPLHGRGTRYKSGTVIYALPMERFKPGQPVQLDPKTLPKLESVPAFLDIYSHGFLYTNNIPRKAVSLPEVKVENPGPNTGKLRAEHRDQFTTTEGKVAAEQLLNNSGTGLGLPAGFRRGETHLVQHFGERLYSYRTWPEYLTTYTVYRNVNGESQAAGEQPIAVPVKDMYGHVLLDGDKVLSAMEYFWDSSLSIVGSPQECLQAGVALMKLREWLLKRYGDSPPLTNVSEVTLGFIARPNDRSTLVPAWIFDAWHVQPIKSTAPGSDAAAPARIPTPFAVNALTGEVWSL